MVVKKYCINVPAYTNKDVTIKLATALILILGLIYLTRNWVATHHPEATKRITTQNGDIYFSLLKDLSDEAIMDENVVISMLDSFAAFYAAYLGAAGETREELEQFVFDESIEFAKVISAYTLNLKSMPNKMDNQSENLVVGVFIQNKSLIRNEYINSLQESFNAVNVENVDFRGKVATLKINEFVSNTTGDRIPHFYESALDPSCQIVLLPVLRATTAWKYVLDTSRTKPEKFFTGKQYVDVDMMNDQNPAAYFDNPSLEFEAIFIPFQDDPSSVLSIVLPYRTQTLGNLTNHMSSEDLFDAFSDSTQIEVNYKIPKMKFSSTKPLKRVFQREGVKTIFGKPDFSRTASNKLRVSDIHQAVDIEVNEKGVSISAATALQFQEYSSKPILKKVGINIPTTEFIPTVKNSPKSMPKNPKEFHVDRPFLLTIIGLLVNPVQSMVHQPNAVSSSD